MVRWNVARGVIYSPERIKEFDSSLISFFMASRLIKEITFFQLEQDLEKVRKEKFPDKVSRLQGLYFFEDKSNADLARSIFQTQVLTTAKIIDPSAIYDKHDMNWITYYNLIKDDPEWMKKYWCGEICPCFEYGPVWECLTNETLQVTDTTIEKQCLEGFIAEDEQFGPLILSANAAARYGYLFGAVFFTIVSESTHIHLRVVMPCGPNLQQDWVDILNLLKEKCPNNYNILHRQFQKNLLKDGSLCAIPDFGKHAWCITESKILKECSLNN